VTYQVPSPGEGWTLGGLYSGRFKVDLLGPRNQSVPKPCTEELWDDSQLPVEYRRSQKGLLKPPESGFESQNQLKCGWDLKPGISWRAVELDLGPYVIWSLRVDIPQRGSLSSFIPGTQSLQGCTEMAASRSYFDLPGYRGPLSESKPQEEMCRGLQLDPGSSLYFSKPLSGCGESGKLVGHMDCKHFRGEVLYSQVPGEHEVGCEDRGEEGQYHRYLDPDPDEGGREVPGLMFSSEVNKTGRSSSKIERSSPAVSGRR
jgi:hypothetical protein